MAYVKVLPVSTADHLKHLIDYVSQESKTMGKDLIHCEECTLEFAYRDFFLVKKMAGKPGGVLAHQIIQSFEPGEVSVKQAHQLGMELAKRAIPGYQYIVCTHTDRDHIHNHIVFNSVSYLTQRKYLGSKASLRVMQAISDDLCREYGLSVIRKGGRRGLDKTTYELARKGKSWKAALAADLDDILPGCNTKQEFIARLEALGYQVRYERYITVRKEGEKKGIRLETLASQFGAEYTTENIERQLMGKPIKDFAPPKEEEIDEKQTEWQRYERYYFEERQPKPKKEMAKEVRSLFSLEQSIRSSRDPAKALLRYLAYRHLKSDPKVREQFEASKSYFSKRAQVERKIQVPLERRIGNVDYTTLVGVAGRNVTIKIPAEKAALFAGMGIFYSGTIKMDGSVLITFKEVNSGRVSQALGVDIGQFYCYGEIREQKMKLREMQLKAYQEGTELYRYNLTYEQIKSLAAMDLPFSYSRNPRKGDYAVFFFGADLQKVCAALGKDYFSEKESFLREANRRRYAELKAEAKNSREKVVYRVVDLRGLMLLRQGNLDMAYFPKDDKFNVAILESELVRYEQLIQQREQSREPEETRR